MEYQAVGFGSHHWLAADAAGRPLFVTVDDLAAKLRKARDTTDAEMGIDFPLTMNCRFGTFAIAIDDDRVSVFSRAMRLQRHPVPLATGAQ